MNMRMNWNALQEACEMSMETDWEAAIEALEATLARKDAALKVAVENLGLIAKNDGERYLDAKSAEYYASVALAACREALEVLK